MRNTLLKLMQKALSLCPRITGSVLQAGRRGGGVAVYYKAIAVTMFVLFFTTIASAIEPIPSSIREVRSRVEYSRLINEGILTIDLNGDGIKDLIVTGHRDHFNAHDFYVHSFYIVQGRSLGIIEIDKEEIEPYPDFSVITRPFDRERHISAVSLIKLKGTKELFLAEAYRTFTDDESLGDKTETFLVLYRLEKIGDENRFMFVQVKVFKTASKYLSAVDAFGELGIKKALD